MWRKFKGFLECVNVLGLLLCICAPAYFKLSNGQQKPHSVMLVASSTYAEMLDSSSSPKHLSKSFPPELSEKSVVTVKQEITGTNQLDVRRFIPRIRSYRSLVEDSSFKSSFSSARKFEASQPPSTKHSLPPEVPLESRTTPLPSVTTPASNSTWTSLDAPVMTKSSGCCAKNMVPRPGFAYDSCDCVYPIKLELHIDYASPSFLNWTGLFQQELASQLGFNTIQIEITAFEFNGSNLSLRIIIGPLNAVRFSVQQAETVKINLEQCKIRFNSSLFGNYTLVQFQYDGLPLPLAVQPPSIVIPSLPLPQILPQVDNNHFMSKRHHSWYIFMIAGVAAVIAVAAVAILLCRFFSHYKAEKRRKNVSMHVDISKEAVTRPFEVRSFATRVFTFDELRDGTNNFELKSVLGEGGFGRVYQGVLKDGTPVAIKKLNAGSQGGHEFMVEVEMLSRLHHRNLVKLIGYFTSSDSHQQLLCYELIPNGNLEQWLHGSRGLHEPLSWDVRMKIALDAARGLAYLHEDSQPPVIHRDFKASNILLDDEFNAKVSDFGLAKQAPEGQQTYVSTQVMGTFGYVAPEYAMTGHLLVKSDVYSYGVVLLELLSGRKSVDMSQPFGQENLVTWALPILGDSERLSEVVDPRLSNQYPIDDFALVASIAMSCVAPEVDRRPTMAEVVQSLKTVQRIGEYLVNDERPSFTAKSDRHLINISQSCREESSTLATSDVNASFSIDSSRTFPTSLDYFSRSVASSEDLHKGR